MKDVHDRDGAQEPPLPQTNVRKHYAHRKHPLKEGMKRGRKKHEGRKEGRKVAEGK